MCHYKLFYLEYSPKQKNVEQGPRIQFSHF